MRLRVSSCLLFVALTLTAFAQTTPAPRVVDVTAPDGTKLKATYFAAAKPGPGIMLFHQCNRERKSWDDLASRLAASGMHVLTLDYRGFGESGGQRADQIPLQQIGPIIAEKWPGDIDAAFQFLTTQPAVKRDMIGAGGASCGVNQSIQLARRHPEVKSLVLLSGGTDRNGREFLRGANLPIFVSAADDDGGVVEIMEWMLALTLGQQNRLAHYKAGGHGVEMFTPHKELPAMIVEWYDATISKTPGKAPTGTAFAKPQASEKSQFLAVLDQPGGGAKAAQMFAEARKRDPKATPFSEPIINQLGYEKMQSNQTKDAIEILKLNVEAFPKSPNAYDSLSDAYLADGQNDLARQTAQKALQLLASDTTETEQRKELIRNSAQQKLQQLGAAKK